MNEYAIHVNKLIKRLIEILIAVKGIDRVRGGKVAVVNSKYKTIYKADIFHKAGSFSTHRKCVAKSGIRRNDLKHGRPMDQITREMKTILSHPKLVITVDGYSDFHCIDLDVREFNMFNLQTYYRRTKDNGTETNGMSLRDIYFLEFSEDFQGTVTHSAEADARATIKIFMEGYTKRIIKKPGFSEYDFEKFDDAVKLKEMDEKCLFFCNTDKRFKNSNFKKCDCLQCYNLFFRPINYRY